MSIAPNRPNQHRDLPGSSPEEPLRIPQPGPIAIAPAHDDFFAEAVVRGGGVVEPLSRETRGLVWLSEKRAEELHRTLSEYPAIEWVQLPWAGVDRFRGLFAELTDEASPVFTSAKGSYAEPVAEHALALMLSLLRELPSKSRDAKWQANRTGLSLYGNHVVIVGAGGITTELVRLLRPFRVSITVVRRNETPFDGAERTVTSGQLHDVLSTADVVVLAAASTAETRHLLGEREFALLPTHAILVNIARGPLIDHDALLNALVEDRLWGAGLDVTEPEPLPADHPLWSQSRCVITSHSADTPLMTAHLLSTRIERNVRAFLTGTPFIGLVDTRAGY